MRLAYPLLRVKLYLAFTRRFPYLEVHYRQVLIIVSHLAYSFPGAHVLAYFHAYAAKAVIYGKVVAMLYHHYLLAAYCREYLAHRALKYRPYSSVLTGLYIYAAVIYHYLRGQRVRVVAKVACYISFFYRPVHLALIALKAAGKRYIGRGQQ